jgi:hypothetical protein
LAQAYPGGVDAFARDCPNQTFCSDGKLSRVGFLSLRDARFFVSTLESYGLVHGLGGAAIDIAVVDQNHGSTLPCLWLEFGHAEEGVALAWLAGRRPGRLYVPRGWDRDRLDAFEFAPAEPFVHRMRFIKTEDDLDWYQDRRTGEVFSIGPVFRRH